MAGCSGSPPKTSLASLFLKFDVRIIAKGICKGEGDALVGLVDIVDCDDGEIVVVTEISKGCSRAGF